jgi:glutaredoxin 3
MAKIEIYTKPMCPYCIRAKALLDKKGANYTDINAFISQDKRREMNERSGRNTFPQIFIDGKHIGGCDDLMALEARGGLDPLLSA